MDRIFKPPFSMTGVISRDGERCRFLFCLIKGEMSIPFLLDKIPTVVPGGSAGEQSGGARNVPFRAARSHSERAAPSTGVGKRFSTRQVVWNRSNRCAGERGGARVGRPRWVRILMITGGSSMAAMIFKLPPQFGQ